MLTFVIFWAYIGFCQFMLMWIADIPDEIAWYRVRANGSWAAVDVFLVVGHFALPFLALLMRWVKHDPRRLAWVGAWVLIADYVDVYWLVMPNLHGAGARPSWTDLAALLAVSGLATAFALWRFGSVARVPRNDPELAESLRFEMP